MTRCIFLSLVFHSAMIIITALSLPFMKRAPIDLPPIVSVELIEITDVTNIPFAPKAREILEKIKEKEKLLEHCQEEDTLKKKLMVVDPMPVISVN